MKKLFTRFTAIITTIAIAATSLCTAAFAAYENGIVGLGAVASNEWKGNGYDNETLNNLYKNDKINSVLSGIKPEWTDIQKAAYIYSYISNNYRHTQDGSVMYFNQGGVGVCETYAEMVYYTLKAAGISSYYVGLNGMVHAVDLVNVNNAWFEVDCDKIAFMAERFSDGYGGSYNQTLGIDNDAESEFNISVSNTSDYYTRDYTYFEYNGQWYAYSSEYIFKIDSSLKNSKNSKWERVFYTNVNKSVNEVTAREKALLVSRGYSWRPTSFAYDGNGKLYFDFFGDVYVYNAATNTSSFVISVGNNISGAVYSKNKINFYSRTSRNSPIAWLGVDKYALYYVKRDGKFGTASLTSNNTALETTKPSLTMRAGEAAYNTAVASTEYLCGYQLSYKSSNESVATVDKYGMVYAKKAGTAYITVSYMDRSSDYKVTVKDMNYSGSVDSVPYIAYYYVKSDSTGNHQIKEIVNAYDPRLTGGSSNNESSGNANTGNNSGSSEATTSKITSTADGSIYKVANDNLYLQVGVPFDLKYIANINENTKVTSSNNKFVAVTKTDTGYTLSAKSNTAYITITNGDNSYRFRVVAYRDSFIPSTFKLSYSSTVVPSKLKVGKTFTLKSISDENATNKISWVISNDNIEITSEVPIWSNSSLTFKAVKKGTTTIYCVSSTGIVKSYKVTIK